MAKPDLGTKRVCPVTGRKFYDLNQNPVVSPYTGQVVPIEAPVSRSRQEAGRAPVAPKPEVEAPEVQDAEFVSLEEADAEAAGAKTTTEDAEDDVELEEVIEDDDDTFLEEDEDEDEDVSDIIGGDIEDEEET